MIGLKLHDEGVYVGENRHGEIPEMFHGIQHLANEKDRVPLDKITIDDGVFVEA